MSTIDESPSGVHKKKSLEHRQKIAETMRKLGKTKEFRKKTSEGSRKAKSGVGFLTKIYSAISEAQKTVVTGNEKLSPRKSQGAR